MSRVEKTKTQGWVYFFQAEGTWLFKIGFTRGSVDARALAIESACPFPIRIQGEIRGTMDDERALHRKLAAFRVHREWFCPPEDVMWDLLRHFGVTYCLLKEHQKA